MVNVLLIFNSSNSVGFTAKKFGTIATFCERLSGYLVETVAKLIEESQGARSFPRRSFPRWFIPR